MFSDIADYNARVEDTFGGIRVVQAFANEEHEKRLFAARNLLVIKSCPGVCRLAIF
jgi:ATP-binding cassette subfamily B protein